MKRLILILFSIFILNSCDGGIYYRIKVKPGDIRQTFTDEYVITEVCDGNNGFGRPFWKKVSIEEHRVIVCKYDTVYVDENYNKFVIDTILINNKINCLEK